MIWSVHGIQLEKNLEKVANENDIGKKLKLLSDMKSDFISKNSGSEADRVIELYDNEIDCLKTELQINSSRLPEKRLNYSALILDLKSYVANIGEEDLKSIIENGNLPFKAAKPIWSGKRVDAWLFGKYFNIKFNNCFIMKNGKKIDTHDEPTIYEGKYRLSASANTLLEILDKYFPDKEERDKILNVTKKRVCK